MEVKAGYKQTEVGVIPEDWCPFTVGDCVKLVNGYGFKASDWGTFGLPIIRIQNLNDRSQGFNFYSGCYDKKHLVETGDLLFAWSGTTGTSFGARLWDGPTGLLNQHIFKVIPNQSLVSLKFALLALLRAQEKIVKEAHGFKTSFVHIKKSDLNKILFSLPPLPEQQAIANALSDADALIESLEQLIEKKRQIKQGVMQELLTGQKRLPGFTGEWETKRLGSLCSMKSGEGITAKNIDSSSQFPCYGGNGLRGFTTRFTHDGNYCLIGRVGALCGNLLEVKGQFFASEHAIVVTPLDSVDISWLTLALGTLRLNGRAESSAQPVLTVSKLLPIEMVVPVYKAEQTAIAAVLSDMDMEIAALKAKLAKTRQVKLGIMQELLTGKVRLI